jgi:putative ABC transport system substrate-binding protein
MIARINRRETIALLSSAAAWPLAARAQQGERVRIGVLTAGDENDPLRRNLISAFTQALARLGWTDGRNLRIDLPLGGKWLELLSEIAPGLKRAAIMFNPESSPASLYMPSLETAALSLKVEPIIAPVHSEVEIETVIIALGREPGGGLVVMPDVFTNVHRAPIISVAAGNNVPAVYWLPAFAREGGLLSYGVDLVDLFRRAATYVDRILRGEKPGDLPVQIPTKFEMAVNLKTAKALGLTVPQSILLRADEVIE